jgi:hypothetical protein
MDYRVLVQHEADARRFSLFRRFASGIFKASGLSSDEFQETQGQESEFRKGAHTTISCAPPHRLDEPTGLSLSTVASPQSRLLFHPAAVVYS